MILIGTNDLSHSCSHRYSTPYFTFAFAFVILKVTDSEIILFRFALISVSMVHEHTHTHTHASKTKTKTKLLTKRRGERGREEAETLGKRFRDYGFLQLQDSIIPRELIVPLK